ncbi:Cytochrome c [Caulifigura coniformis]|uniref:Cytochrome c n=1 Tax=Caulifigura coniformis TaxID=2527983 RepID=A0A517SGA9_9PLAN|nr:cytochrome c [Caulifigura coniformis]QDT55163.1 Cytochrome c [Caulifigura coniformis]
MAFAAGCHQDMYDQAKKESLEASAFFKDGRTARPLVPGTIAQGQLETDTPMFTGRQDGQFVDSLPMPVSQELLAHGQTQFNIYCTPCHGSIGDGNGMIPARGFKRPPSFHIERLRGAPVGHYFDVISNGFGAMPVYKNRISPQDRWAIIAYVRALQFSQFAPVDALSPADLNALNNPVRGTTDAPRQ